MFPVVRFIAHCRLCSLHIPSPPFHHFRGPHAITPLQSLLFAGGNLPSAPCLLSVSLPHSAAHNKNTAAPPIPARLVMPCLSQKYAPAAPTALGHTPHSHQQTQRGARCDAAAYSADVHEKGNKANMCGEHQVLTVGPGVRKDTDAFCLPFCSPQLSPIKTHRRPAVPVGPA